MKTKQILAGLLSAALCVSLLTACGKNESKNEQSKQITQSSASEQSKESKSGDQSEQSKSDDKSEPSKTNEQSGQTKTENSNTHTLYIRDNGKTPEMTAVFFNSASGESENVAMKKTGEGSDYFTYSCEGNTEKYNMVRLKYNDRESMDIAFNNFISGWYLWNDELLPYVEGKEPKYDPQYETKSFKFQDTDKDVYIWTPADYDAKSADKYSTIYMIDGQSTISTKLSAEYDTSYQVWNVCEHVESMMAVTDNKAIIVGINTTENRFNDLTPNIGGNMVTAEENRNGTAFANFVCDTIIPYVQENYNVYKDAEHTSIAGSSMGGLESLYMAIEHTDKFGTAGVLSPSLWNADEDSWKAYFDTKKNNTDFPFLYFYSGSFGQDTGYCTEPVYNAMIDSGYPKDKLVFNKNEKAEHFVPFWRNVYPEFLEAMFTHKVSGLECGVKVTYEDRTPPDMPSDPNASDIPDRSDDTRPESITKYIFYDNSETKWDKVYAYWWGGVTDDYAKNMVTGEDYGGPWPGILMEQIEGTDIYKIAAPQGPTGFIFNSGVTDEEVLKGVTAYQTVDLTYNSAVNAGQIYKIDISQDPKPGRGVEKTKYKYPAGTWTDYYGSENG